MKRTEWLRSYIGSLTSDLCRFHPECQEDLRRSESRVCLLLASYGEGVILREFPKIGKWFDHCLSRGQLTREWHRFMGPIKDWPTPVLYRELFVRIFGPDGTLLPDADHQSIQSLRQVFHSLKKVSGVAGDEVSKEKKADFFRIEKSLRKPTQDWARLGFSHRPSFRDGLVEGEPALFHFSGEVTGSRTIDRLVDTLEKVADRIVASFGYPDPFPLGLGRHGPGAVADLKTGTDKYTFPSWPRRLAEVYPPELFAAANLRTAELYGWTEGVDEPSKLICVPKSTTSVRLIASEPTAHMWIQQLQLQMLRKMVDKTALRRCINFTSQVPSQEMARRATTEGDLATVDLSDASDRLSLWTVERMFRSNSELLRHLAASRSVWATDPDLGTVAVLRKYAPQGNATTFPVQSICYALLSIAALLTSEAIAPTKGAVQWASRRVRVFGDDIIIPGKALPYLSLLFQLCQLKLNLAKTHSHGIFAESCGADWYRGYDVTPCYVDFPEAEGSPQAVASTVEISNNLFRAGYWHCAENQLGILPQHYRGWLTAGRDGTIQGMSLTTFSKGVQGRVKQHPTLCKPLVRGLVLSAKVTRGLRENWMSLAQFFSEAPSVDTDWASGWNRRVKASIRRRWVPVVPETD